ncbi:MAG: transcriptional repressor [Elusimicrobiales bacterium]|nr:transcriptional repressor [Elusimicrobiales bacterium]
MNSGAIRITPARGAVLGALRKAARPLSHQELHGSLGARAFDRVTVYRALEALEAAGLLHRVHGPDGVWRFRSNPEETGACAGNHAHFLCSSCGKMACLTGQPLPWVKNPPGAVIVSKQYVAHGYCAACAVKLKEKKK